MDRKTILWTVVLFFGCSIVSRAISNATSDSPPGVQIGLQVLAFAVIVGAVVLYVKRSDGGD